MRLARITFAIAWLCLLTCGGACGGDDSAAAPPATGGGKGGRGGGVKPPVTVKDAGGGLDDEDGGGDPLGVECARVPAAPFGETVTEDYFNSIGSPRDFAVTRVVGTWDNGCKTPTVKIVLSNGRCPDGDGHELTFFLAIDSLLEGENTLVPEPDGEVVRVRYTRPKSIEPSGTWGSCPGSNGTFNIKGPLDPEDPGNLQAMFQLELTKCDGSSATGTQMVTGRLNVTMRRTVKDVCP